ncbi:lamin tail domain-containing protein [Streptomyces sp. NPDC059862]|uniref:lamin tail domain-containing protein n=1 Tax=Streptomyces sp. NPDC059862 TaxID=3346975 RepID=UPI0036569403
MTAPVGQVTKDFDLSETAMRDWGRQAEVDAGERDGPTSSEREKLAQLRRENRRLREDVEILKRATAPASTPSSSARHSLRPQTHRPADAGRRAHLPQPRPGCARAARPAATHPPHHHIPSNARLRAEKKGETGARTCRRPHVSSSVATARRLSAAALTAAAVLGTTALPASAAGHPRPDGAKVEISAVQYDSPGYDDGSDHSLNREWVEITNNSRRDVDLDGWTLQSEDGDTYTFDRYRLEGRTADPKAVGNGADRGNAVCPTPLCQVRNHRLGDRHQARFGCDYA